MTLSEGYNTVVEMIDGQLAETAHKWGYTVQKKESGEWVYWQISEFSPYLEVAAAHKLDPYIHLYGVANQTCCIYLKHCSPEELRKTIGAFAKRVLEQVITIWAWKELRKILGDACRKGVGIMSKKIVVEIDPETLYLEFEMGDDSWSWEITSEYEGKPIAIVRQPLCKHPIRALTEIAKRFAVALI
jgi:hypothetical protein